MAGILTEKEYEIHYYEVDYKNRALITSLIDYFGDIAIHQSETLNIGMDYLKENNIAWILYKWDIKVKRYPKFREKIKIGTQPYGIKKFYAYRNFYILSEDGEKIVTADSVWMLIDTVKRKPIKINGFLKNTFGLTDDDNKILKIHKLNKIDKIDNEVDFRIRYSDIDTNGHVNNEKYAAWLIESVPLDIVLNHTLENIKITYRKETKYGETIKVLTKINHEDDKIVCIHKIVNVDKELTLGETIWRKS
ncbi:thioesterase [Clostridium aestuarii]|uniref:Thioesterase n=1 Tax=Clostridium aestuarii TaxID=338193 RepID=A0ABT4D226_9CLOT|nr:acyl-ACP thioesterase domain-containing protein [Clostridium aestuarii]MCY6485294.1 thioesterase [Clostridium aestuarii]